MLFLLGLQSSNCAQRKMILTYHESLKDFDMDYEPRECHFHNREGTQ